MKAISRITRVRLVSFLLTAGVIASSRCPADEFPEPPPHVKTYELTISASAEPKPALKYRLFPVLGESGPGNAAAHYSRALQLFAPTQYQPKEQRRFETEWFGESFEKLPATEVREWLNSQKNVIEQLEVASRCETCDWGIRFQDLRGRAVVDIPLPEFQQMRQMSRILSLKTTLEIGEKRFNEAIETLKVQYCLARNLGKAPNVIPNLVGIAVQAVANESLIKLMSSEGSPNFYWALRDIPDPLIDIRGAVQMEASTLVRLFPFLEEADKTTRTPEEWQRLLFDAFSLVTSDFSEKAVNETSTRLMFAGLMTSYYPIAKRELIASGYDADHVNQMPVGQVVAIFVRKCNQDMMDRIVRWTLIPYAEGHARLKAEWEQLGRDGYLRSGQKMIPDMDPLLFTSTLAFAAEQFNEAPNRQRRLMAMMAAVEAIRLHLATHEGKLPATLSEITEVTVPADPGTGKPFLYRIANRQIELLAPPTMPGVEFSGRRFRLTIR